MSVLLGSSGASVILGSSGGGVVLAGGVAKSLVTMDDLTFQGQFGAPEAGYAPLGLAIRYVGGQRRYLICIRNGSDAANEYMGDLVEYRFTGTLQTTANINTLPGWSEVRRWKQWINIDLASDPENSVFRLNGGNGAAVGSFYWDESQSALFYTWLPNYPGSERYFAPYCAVVLDDAEAVVVGDGGTSGNVVSAGNRKGPWSFRDAAVKDDWKDATCALIPIPADRQATLGKFFAAGHHCANIGTAGAHGLGLWSVTDLPTLASPPADYDELWPSAVHVYNTGSNAGVTPFPMRQPNSNYNLLNVHHSTAPYIVRSGTLTTTAGSVGTDIGDAIYQGNYNTNYVDCITVQMSTGAAGGTWVPEIYNGSAWVEPSGWAVGIGDAALTGAVNSFYWPKVSFSQSTPHVSLGTAYWTRLRRTATGSSGGTAIRCDVAVSQPADAGSGGDRPDPVGGYTATPNELYDASHYGFCYSNYFYGGAFVSTDNVEGLVYIGSFYTGGVWYGSSIAHTQPPGGGVPARHVDSHYGNTEGSNGNWSTGTQKSYLFTFDADHLAEAKAGTRAANASALNPAAFYDLRAETPGLSVHWTALYGPDAGEPSDFLAGWGNEVVFDPNTNELILLLMQGTNNSIPLVAIWSVR